ncbi:MULTISPECIES: NADPH-dependent F420 reductase [Mycolicibacterium]|uniref:F420-dependent NADP reductase n=1 Tax=Mycolicibacterium mageritense TaxID=53462 RepID=A0AAI8XPR5_MYCME|nr:NADPH-dependent F420 reductase [Mycolicibacterium mageritense]MBN3453910.1 NADPH-dependent F420 reductase [Mycobacterium sp. DSM 3803]MCC9182680.1 NADPH-dependent F420 reductase [Mycolicibacterium mageritense]TXI65511.1 MAG: NADPH-dependent F420 reductase [Mycolicibacterium mageritense]CDO26919.1 reductase [Mycolicibacterium mageritense DSM 44476 = CIP 104973]BBX38348.1 F420-dependent NADP reductase [Mycolicibacterium mageritense]
MTRSVKSLVAEGDVNETVSILGGTGNLGFGLAVRLGAAGYRVCLGSRDVERARRAAAQADELVEHGTFVGCLNSEAVTQADRLVIAAVPFASHVATLRSVAEHWRAGQVLLDTTVPLATAVGGRPTHLVEPWHGSAAQQARSAIDDRIGLVAGLHTISAAALRDLSRPLDQDTLICGDRRGKELVAAALERIDGLRVVDAGSLEMSRLLEGLTPVLIGINIRNKTHAGIQVTHLGTRPAQQAALA